MEHPLAKFIREHPVRRQDCSPCEYQFLRGYINPTPSKPHPPVPRNK